ncbi:putative extracellular protein [Venturia nashicola]|uniref:Putative extracellular protein n=1 Tax=Venturia nashicola TaxID=86259 RepID=A0A4Z1P0F4_9PEZI|nr:putative extracellular protein [Venturia nashicola]TLD25946.1 putative extracellular protein [Venturia nashicola]
MKIFFFFPAVLALSLNSDLSAAKVQCPGTFKPISAANFVKAMTPGWNLGNTLDAVGGEGKWNNPPVVEKTFNDVKAAGFKGIRLPVTWTTKIGPAPSYTVDPAWLTRVSTVIDQITARNMSVIVNVHHDSWEWFDFTKDMSESNINTITSKFSALWKQIGTKLACKNSMVAFEPINEPVGSTKQHADVLNKMNGVFLKAIASAGGWNEKRVVTLVGLGEDSIKTSQWFKKPEGDWTNPWALQYHYYSPYGFIFSAIGATIWGSDADKAAVDTDLRLIRGNFTDVPLIIGEWAASPVATESAARWRYFDYFTRAAAKYNTGTILWDNGNDFLDRAKGTWRDDVAKQIYIAASRGIANSIPTSTTDAQATQQHSSAYLFQKAGMAPQAQSLKFHLNGNTVKSIKMEDGSAMTTHDYSVNGSMITFPNEFISRFMNPTTKPGIKATLIVKFSAGADSKIQLVQWDTPKITGEASSKAVTGKEVKIPVTFNGLPKVATVKALLSDGRYLVDDWTQYLGPMQKARAAYNGIWNFDDSHLILTSGAANAVVSAKKSATFTFEFYPRVAGNAVNYTLTV